MASSKSSKITVAVRVRPKNAREIELGASDSVEVSDGRITMNRTLENDAKSFNFDIAYSSNSDSVAFGSQERIYNEIGARILEEALEGINQCLFAYGQTGSGKSYTMTGYEDPGIIPRLTEDLFQRVARSQGQIKVWVSYMEIYNEHIHDLLRPENSEEENLSIYEHQKLGVVVPDATVLPVTSIGDVKKLMDQGIARRVSASTSMNATSSRSHAIYTLHVESSNSTSRINLIDLAGSERISKTHVTGENQREAAMINQSLTNLGLVIKALSEKKDFVPFRNSKLTFLLKDSLSGNSRTYMVANVSPAETEAEETLSTLRFASNVKRITTSPQVNYGTHEDLVNALKLEIEQLKAQLNGSSSKQHATALVAGEESSPELRGAMKMKAAVLRMIQSSVVSKIEQEHKLRTNFSSSAPYLVNVSADPAATGPLSIQLLPPGQSLVLGREDSSVLKILPTTCTVKIARIERRNDLIFLHANGVMNILLNRKPLRGADGGGEVELSANDIIDFGAKCMYRLVVPGADEEGYYLTLQPVSRDVVLAARKLEEKLRTIPRSADHEMKVRLIMPPPTSRGLDEQILVEVTRGGEYEFFDVPRFDRVFGLVKSDDNGGGLCMADLIRQLEQLELRVNKLDSLLQLKIHLK